jgi:hypothetical protein
MEIGNQGLTIDIPFLPSGLRESLVHNTDSS